MTTEKTAATIYEKINNKVLIDIEIKCRADLRNSMKRHTRLFRDKVSEILFEYAVEEESEVDGKIRSNAYHGFEEFKHTLDSMIEHVIDTVIACYLKKTVDGIVESYGKRPTKFNIERFIMRQPAYDQLGRRVEFVRKDKIGITYMETNSKRQSNVHLEDAMRFWVMRDDDEQALEA